MKYLRVMATAIALQACTTVSVTQLEKAAQKDSSCQLDFYMEQNDIKTKFVKACEIRSNIGATNATESPRAEALKNAREHLCACGADGVLYTGMGGGAFQKSVELIGVTYVNKPEATPLDYEQGLIVLGCRDENRQWMDGKCGEPIPTGTGASERRRGH